MRSPLLGDVTPMANKAPRLRNIPIIALALAWLVPGAGHVYIGRVGRGVIIFLTISALFWAGMAMGGAMTVDCDRERWWCVSQMLTGVHGLVGWQVQRAALRSVGVSPVTALRDPSRADKQLAEEGLALVAPTGTVARAYAGVAGLLNLMCIFDALVLSLMGVFGETAPEPMTEPAKG